MCLRVYLWSICNHPYHRTASHQCWSRYLLLSSHRVKASFCSFPHFLCILAQVIFVLLWLLTDRVHLHESKILWEKERDTLRNSAVHGIIWMIVKFISYISGFHYRRMVLIRIILLRSFEKKCHLFDNEVEYSLPGGTDIHSPSLSLIGSPESMSHLMNSKLSANACKT